MSHKEGYDIDHDGNVTDEELVKVELISELESKIAKSEAQKKLAWAALLLMAVFTLGIFGPWVPLDRLVLLVELSGMFYIAQASIVGAYMGFTSIMSLRK